ncbi:hypothetical protein ACH0CV_14295 [Brachybacterium paraconglomeratum]
MRSGPLTAGESVPAGALDPPEALRTLHVNIRRAGSDGIETFMGNRPAR